MGDWSITIRGRGVHHNKKLQQDANRMAAEFVQRLKDAGHTVLDAGFVSGSSDAVDGGKDYLETRDDLEG